MTRNKRDFIITAVLFFALFFLRGKGIADTPLKPALTVPTALTPQLKPESKTPYEKSQEKENEIKKEVTEKDKAKAKKERGELKPFGFEFFAQAPETFAPSPEAPIPPDYTLAPGDEMNLTVFSSVGQQTIYPLKVDVNGSVYIPMMGKISVNGLTMDALEQKALRFLKAKYPQIGLYLSLEKIHTIKVFVTGEARRPGGYLLSGVSTAFNALFTAGGPNKRGSMRNIALIRKGRRIATIDLYRYLLYGREKFYDLQSGDVLFIPVVGAQVAIEGEVKRAAIFELKGEKTLSQLLKMAGGLTPLSDAQHIQVERIKNHTKKILLDLSLNAHKTFQLEPGDHIKVFPVTKTKRNRLVIEGKVEKPGEYAYEKGMRVKDLIAKAGGILKTEPVFMERADIFRIDSEGRTVIVSFSLRKAVEGKGEDNKKLSPFDRMVIYSPDEAMFLDRTVRVEGAIKVAGVYIRTEKMRISDLIHMGGGILPEASDQVELASANREKKILLRTLSLKNILAHKKDDRELQDGDIVTIKKKGRFIRKPETILIEGEVKFPGAYALVKESDTLYDLIKRAGGIEPTAFLEGAVFTRQEKQLTLKEQQKTVAKITKALNYLLETEYEIELAQFGIKRENKGSEIAIPSISSTIANSSQIKTAAAIKQAEKTVLSTELPEEKLLGVGKPQKIKVEETNTRVAINLPLLVQSHGKKGDIIVKPGDRLFIPKTPLTVSVVGSVVNPASILYAPQKEIEYYTDRAGGFTAEANKRKTIVVRANGEILPKKKVKKIARGDIIIVPPKPILVKSRKTGFERFKDVFQVITNAATGVLTILAIKNIGK